MTGKSELWILGVLRNLGEKVFMSSTTHGGETIGIRAALETLNFYKKNDVIGHNHLVGEQLFKECNLILKNLDFHREIKIEQNYWMLVFSFNHKNKLIPNVQTLFSQEMIKNGVLLVFCTMLFHKKKG